MAAWPKSLFHQAADGDRDVFSYAFSQAVFERAGCIEHGFINRVFRDRRTAVPIWIDSFG